MHSSQLAHSLIRDGASTIHNASSKLIDTDFLKFGKDGPSMAWTLIHLTGQLEWAIKVTSNQDSSPHLIDILEEFKGDVSLADAGKQVTKLPGRSEIESMYDLSVSRALNVLETVESKWTSPPYGDDVVKAFGTIGKVWQAVAWHSYWHLGNLSATYRGKLSPADTQPQVFIGTLT